MPEGDGDPPGRDSEKRKLPKRRSENDSRADALDATFYKPYLKPGYTRVFPKNAADAEFTVFVESTKNEKIGNRNPLVMAGLFKNDIKGVANIKRINANKIGVIFSQAINANDFLKNEQWLQKNEMKAFIPAGAVETIGVIRFVPTSISNEELFKKLSSKYEVVSVRRFTKKMNGEIIPFGSVSVTFLSKSLPECVYLDIYRFKVSEYVAPLLQCYKCFRFNHSAKFCSAAQKCSKCSEEHHYSECTNDEKLKCINCGGPHLAIHRDCPVKQSKIAEKNNVRSYARVTASNISNDFNKDFPILPERQSILQPEVVNKPKPTPAPKPEKPSLRPLIPSMEKNKNLVNEIVNSDYILKSLVGALVTLGNTTNTKITTQSIRDVLIQCLTHTDG